MYMNWKTIDGFPDYEVSDLGCVRSHKSGKPRILKPQLSGPKRNYQSVALWKDATYKRVRIHQLVAQHFIGPQEPGMDVRHLDGNTLNNHVSNLAYGSRSENMRDAVSHGTATLGEKAHHAKLTERKVRIIRGLHKCDFAIKRLAEMFTVSPSTISAVLRRDTWAWVA